MDDRFQLNKYASSCLIILGLGLSITEFFDLSAGLIISFLGLAGFVISSIRDIYLTGSLVTWTIGVQFVISHWPNGRLIILIGTILTSIALFFRFKKDKFINYKLWILISLLILFISYNFKLQNIEYSFIIYIIGGLSLIVSYGLRFVNKSPKKVEDSLKLIFIYTILLNYLFMLGHYPGYNIVRLILIISTIGLGGYSLVYRIKNDKKLTTANTV